MNIEKYFLNILKGKNKYYPKHLYPKVFANMIGGDEKQMKESEEWYIKGQKDFENKIKHEYKQYRLSKER
jgi:hypothetical protein